MRGKVEKKSNEGLFSLKISHNDKSEIEDFCEVLGLCLLATHQCMKQFAVLRFLSFGLLICLFIYLGLYELACKS